MIENLQIENSKKNLSEIERLPNPTMWRMSREWYEERVQVKYHAGFVVGMILDEDDPGLTRIYFDAGRRRPAKNGKMGIVLETVFLRTDEVMEQNLTLGDLVRASWRYGNLEKIASQNALTEQGIIVPTSSFLTSFDWDQVIGFN